MILFTSNYNKHVHRCIKELKKTNRKADIFLVPNKRPGLLFDFYLFLEGLIVLYLVDR